MRRMLVLWTVLIGGVLGLSGVRAARAQDGTGAVTLTFERLDKGVFRAVLRPQAPARVVDALPTFTLSRGTTGTTTLPGDGTVSIEVLPDETFSGEYRVEASGTLDDGALVFTIARTALVLPDVADGWGQPAAVDGLVNTDGWEDSAAISPDGEWLFLLYVPIAINCLLGQQRPEYCDVARGPSGAPARPDMPGADRIGTDGRLRHACRSLGLDPAPFPIPPQTLYGFRRQDDGSFADPFPLYLDNADGCFSPFGPSVRINGDGTARVTLAFVDERNVNALWWIDVPLGEPTVLGRLAGYSDYPIIDPMYMQRLDAPAPGTQGNPHVSYGDDGALTVFWDDETLPESDRRIVVAVYDGAAWSPAQVLNFAPFAADGRGEIQPFFDGGQLLVRHGDNIDAYPYLGGAFDAPASWGRPRTLLGVGTPTFTTGSVITLGEPTLAVRDGRTLLYFVYAILEANGAFNLNVGYVETE